MSSCGLNAPRLPVDTGKANCVIFTLTSNDIGVVNLRDATVTVKGDVLSLGRQGQTMLFERRSDQTEDKAKPMDNESERIVRQRVPRGGADGGVGPWWKPSPLACWFFAIAGFDVLMLLLASGVSSAGNDAAGNGMANAFRDMFVQAGAVLVGGITALFVVVRHRGIRIGLMATLVLLSLSLPILLH